MQPFPGFSDSAIKFVINWVIRNSKLSFQTRSAQICTSLGPRLTTSWVKNKKPTPTEP